MLLEHDRMVEMAKDLALQRPFLRLASHFTPVDVLEKSKVRVGSEFDGGYIMLDDFAGNDLAISLGVDFNSDWDLEIVKRGVPVVQFDHTVLQSIPHERITFFQKQIVPVLDGEGEASINSILGEAGVSRDASVILKMDIEGDEWPVLDACDAADLKRISQFVVEFHRFSRARDPVWLYRAEKVMAKLTAIFGIFHVHANNWSPLVPLGNVYFPDTLEVSFASRERYRFGESSELFPTGIDRANNPLKPDIYLGSFKFPQIPSD